MDRESFLSRRVSAKEITLDDGTTVVVKKLTQGEFETVQRSYKDKVGEGMRFIVARTMIDADGKRIFSDDDVKSLADQDAGTIIEISNAVLAFSGLMPKSKDDTKNA